MVLCEYCKILKNTYFEEQLWTAASAHCMNFIVYFSTDILLTMRRMSKGWKKGGVGLGLFKNLKHHLTVQE